MNELKRINVIRPYADIQRFADPSVPDPLPESSLHHPMICSYVILIVRLLHSQLDISLLSHWD